MCSALKIITTFMGLLLAAQHSIEANEIPGLRAESVIKRKTVDYRAYDALLKEAVNAKGEVNYPLLVKKRDKLREIVQEFLNTDPETLVNREEKLAFYINTYNSVTLYQVTLHYPVKTVLYNFPGGEFFKNTFSLGGKSINLDQLEKEIILGQFRDPYIHFAINCASASCPILENRAWRANGLRPRMQAAARRYLSQKQNANFDASSNTLYLSELFRWYAHDFGDVVKFYSQVTGQKLPAAVKVEYLTYDWSLNEKMP